jgi:hypothetical protein
MQTARLQVDVLLSELGKYDFVHEFACETVAMALLEGDIDVPTPDFIYNVVVGDCLSTLLLFRDLIETLADFVG